MSNSSTFSENEWEEVKEKTDTKIEAWIDSQLTMRSCLVVLVGATTSSRKWVKYEIEKAYEMGKAIVGVHIHGLKDNKRSQTTKGSNPFYSILVGKIMRDFLNMLNVTILLIFQVTMYIRISKKTLKS